MATYEDARRAQRDVLRKMRSRYPEVSGMGIARIADGWGYKVNLRRAPRRKLPTEVDGVPVVGEIVGRVAAVSAGGR